MLWIWAENRCNCGLFYGCFLFVLCFLLFYFICLRLVSSIRKPGLWYLKQKTASVWKHYSGISQARVICFLSLQRANKILAEGPHPRIPFPYRGKKRYEETRLHPHAIARMTCRSENTQVFHYFRIKIEAYHKATYLLTASSQKHWAPSKRGFQSISL